MSRKYQGKLNQAGVLVLVAIGVILTALSVFYASSFLAILGVGIVFWGIILLYVTPVRHVPLRLLSVSAVSNSGTVERLLSEMDMTEKGYYLPPRYLKDFESSLVFIPEKPGQELPEPGAVDEEKLLSSKQDGLFLSPPGLDLCRLFEKELGVSFTRTDLSYFQQKLPKVLIEDMEMAENVEVQIQSGVVAVDVTGSVLDEVCQETDRQPRVHELVGCLLSSAIACALAKTTGEPVIIQKESRNPESKATHIEFQVTTSSNPPVGSPGDSESISSTVPPERLRLYSGLALGFLSGLEPCGLVLGLETV